MDRRHGSRTVKKMSTIQQLQTYGAEEDPGSIPLRTELAMLQEKNIRLLAELENTRKRMARELEKLRRADRDAITRDFLEVVDTVERALACVRDSETVASPRDNLDPQDRAAGPWKEGMEGIHRLSLDLLRRHDVVPIQTGHVPFDPELHEAVSTEWNADFPSGYVVRTLRRGYATADGRVIRPAQVVVARRAH